MTTRHRCVDAITVEDTFDLALQDARGRVLSVDESARVPVPARQPRHPRCQSDSDHQLPTRRTSSCTAPDPAVHRPRRGYWHAPTCACVVSTGSTGGWVRLLLGVERFRDARWRSLLNHRGSRLAVARPRVRRLNRRWVRLLLGVERFRDARWRSLLNHRGGVWRRRTGGVSTGSTGRWVRLLLGVGGFETLAGARSSTTGVASAFFLTGRSRRGHVWLTGRRRVPLGCGAVEETKLRVMVVDDHPMWREGVARDLAEAGFDVVATAANGKDAITRFPAARPDVLVLDLQIPEPNGVAVTAEVVRQNPAVRVLILSASGEQQDVLDAVKAGATGYLVKSASRAELVDAVRRVALGDTVFTPGLAGLVLGEYRRLSDTPAAAKDDTPRLTERETEVLRLVAKGMSYKQIAERLFLSHRTVQNHVQNTLRKLQLHNRVQLVRYAIEQGLDDVDERRRDTHGAGSARGKNHALGSVVDAGQG